MQEQLLQFIWHQKLFDQKNLQTTTGQKTEILHQGIPNHDQGPDFLQARIRIADEVWAGHVEIHIRSSEWYVHRHDQDTHYHNVILHVVWTEDQPVYVQNTYRIPCIELATRVDPHLMDRYHHLMNNRQWVPCAGSLQEISPLIRTTWLGRLMTERLESKTQNVFAMYHRCGGDWEQTFYVLLARQLGVPVNSDAMETLALKLPLNLLRKHNDRIDQVESLLFGVAGMLGGNVHEAYPNALKKEFDFLKIKYGLDTMPALRWKFMRMRPLHYPTIRIAQLARIIVETPHFVSLLASSDPYTTWLNKFMVTPHHPYWDHHFHFKNEAPPVKKRLGKDTACLLMINMVAPFMFSYGKMQGISALKEMAIELLTHISPEQNAIIRGWNSCGWIALDAGESQAMIQLKKNYCDQQRCLHCVIGMKVMKNR